MLSNIEWHFKRRAFSRLISQRFLPHFEDMTLPPGQLTDSLSTSCQKNRRKFIPVWSHLTLSTPRTCSYVGRRGARLNWQEWSSHPKLSPMTTTTTTKTTVSIYFVVVVDLKILFTFSLLTSSYDEWQPFCWAHHLNRG